MTTAQTKPDVHTTTIHQWLDEHYGLAGELQPLPGERDLNFKLICETGESFVCKVCDASEDTALLAAQNDVLAHLEDHALSSIPQVRRTNQDQSTIHVQCGEQRLVLRVLTYVPGEVLAKRAPYSTALLHDFGRMLGKLTLALDGFDQPAFHYAFDWDLAHGLPVVQRHVNDIADPKVRSAVQQIGDDFKNIAHPRLDALPKSVIHNDANDYNILAQDDAITGLIDFGDMVYTCTICDLAIAIAYATLGCENPLHALAEMTSGYHAVRPIQPEEMAVLLPMVRMRLAVSACMAARQMQQRPDDPYLAISQEPIRKTLPKLMGLDLDNVEMQLKAALG